MTDETPAITAAEMQATREYLGLSTKWISEQLVMNERRLTRMETGQEPSIPLAVAKLLDEVYEDARETVGRMTAVYRRKAKASRDEPVLLKTYRTDVEYKTAGGKYPARWHRQVCARVAEAVPAVVIEYIKPEEIAGVNIGERIRGIVTNVTDFGAFVRLGDARDGLIHISASEPGKRVEQIGDLIRRGDEVEVEVLEVDASGRINLKRIGA